MSIIAIDSLATAGGSASSSTAGLKVIPPATPVANPLNDWASYSYTWSWWWLDPTDFNYLMTAGDLNTVLAYNLPNSYVIAEDAGLYPDRRLPSTLGLNYHIQDVKFSTTMAPGGKWGATNAIEGSMTVLEPYGLSLIDSLVAASFNGVAFDNWTDRPHLLELNFHGYDDAGNAMSQSLMPLYRKRFPIKVTTMTASLNTHGAEYKISYVAAGQQSFGKKYGYLPKDVTVSGGNVQEVLDDLASQLNAYYGSQTLPTQNTAAFADHYAFVIDPALGVNNSIVGGADRAPPLELQKGDENIPNAKKLDFSFTTQQGITEVVGKIMARGSFFQNQLVGQSGNISSPYNTFKILTAVTYEGHNAAGNPQGLQFDIKQGVFSRKITYKIVQYVSWQNHHPNCPSLMADSTPYTCKVYTYTYGGKNTDVLDLKLEFNNTWFTTVMSQTEVIPSSNPSASTLAETKMQSFPEAYFIPSLISRMSGYTNVGTIANPTPMSIRPIINNQNITAGAGIVKDPLAQQVADVHHSLYTSNTGQMNSVPLTILGDPTLIKQDDWLYVPGTDAFAEYHDTSISNSDFVAKYGHFRTDLSEIPVTLTVNTILDMDTELNNAGLGWPNPGSTYNTAIFSGQYVIVRVENMFQNGKFTQVLQLTRYLNGSITSAVSLAQNRGRQAPIDLNTVYTNNLASSLAAKVTGSVPPVTPGR